MSEMRDPWAFQRWAYETQTGSPVRKLLLTALATMADSQTGRCQAKQATLATWAEVQEPSVRPNLKALEEAGLIARRPQYRKDGGRRTDEFLLLAPWVECWPDGEPATPPASDTGTPPTPDTGARTTTEGTSHASSLRSSAGSSGRADARETVPDDFPDELRPHARTVMSVLKKLAAKTPNAKAVHAASVGNVIMARPYKPLVKAVYDYAAWVEGGNRRRTDFVAGYRNWLDRTDDLAAYEPLTEDGRPVPGAAPTGRPPQAGIKDERLAASRERARRAWEEDQAAEGASK